MADQKTIWVTGANGQLGRELQAIAHVPVNANFLFTTREQVAINQPDAVRDFLDSNKVDVCINAAAYTAVDLAEKERDLSMDINGTAVGSLAAACNARGAAFIHVSSDYVFDGNAKEAYKETDLAAPVNYYGQTKLAGERFALEAHPGCVIVRTSWVYSSFGKNFVKTMLKLMSEKTAIGVVSDQFGSPTYAGDLAKALVHLATGKFSPGIYHYCNTGVISWFQFATAIRDISGSACEVNPITTSDYPTPAKRPAYSALDTSKFSEQTGLVIPGWYDSLRTCLDLLR